MPCPQNDTLTKSNFAIIMTIIAFSKCVIPWISCHKSIYIAIEARCNYIINIFFFVLFISKTTHSFLKDNLLKVNRTTKFSSVYLSWSIFLKFILRTWRSFLPISFQPTSSGRYPGIEVGFAAGLRTHANTAKKGKKPATMLKNALHHV